MTAQATLPTDVAPAWGAVPDAPRAHLHALRQLVLEEAAALSIPLTETLKWGQPAFLPPKKDGTTIRLGWSDKHPGEARRFVHCQTSLVSTWRDLFPDLTYDGNRAICLPPNSPLPEAPLRHAIAMALTYHRKG